VIESTSVTTVFTPVEPLARVAPEFKPYGTRGSAIMGSKITD